MAVRIRIQIYAIGEQGLEKPQPRGCLLSVSAQSELLGSLPAFG